MRTLSLTSPSDVAMLVPTVLGFQPEESIVVLGLGGAPTARVDIPAASVLDYAELAAVFSHPVPEWRKNGVLVVVYTADAEAFGYWVRHGSATLPGVLLHDMIRVHDGQWFGPFDTEGTPFVSDPSVAASRDVFVTEAQQVDTAQEAERMAIAAWHEGNGARAWCLHDRAVELTGHTSEHMRRLAHALETAINPRTAPCDPTGLPIERN